MSDEAILVLSTFPDADTARRIARILIEQNLAACVNLLPQIESIYRWEGAIETSTEVLALIKTTSWRYIPLEAKILELHPYQVPEIISLPITAGSAEYLRWIDQSVVR